MELITKKKEKFDDDPETKYIVERHFPELFITMLSLVQFVTLDSIGAIYLPLIRKDPILLIFFMLFILVVSI